MAPAVSVILNCYNHEAYVAEAIESVLGQTFADFELILIDNGSTDGSRAILDRYDDPRIRRLFHDENQSLAKRLNEGVAAATGEFVAVLYSDDWMLPDKLERQVAMFRALGPEYGVVYCPALGFNQITGERWQYRSYGLSGPMMPRMLEQHIRGPLDMSSPLTRRSCFELYPWHEDLFADGEAVFLRIGMRWHFHYDPQPTVVLRDHGGNAGKVVRKNQEMFLKVLRRLARDPDFRPEWSDALRRLQGLACAHGAWLAVRLGDQDMRWVRSQVASALRHDRRQILKPRLTAALLLSLLPSAGRRMLNRIASSLRRRPENAVMLSDY